MTYRSHRKEPDKEAKTGETQIVFILDLAGNLKFINSAAEVVSGYSSEEACGMNVTHIVVPEQADYISRQVRQAVHGRCGAVYEIEIITKDRRRLILETSTQLVMRDGEPFELHGIAFPAVRAGDGEADVQLRCLDKEFVSMLVVSAFLPLTNHDRGILNLSSYRPFKL